MALVSSLRMLDICVGIRLLPDSVHPRCLWDGLDRHNPTLLCSRRRRKDLQFLLSYHRERWYRSPRAV